MSWHQAYGICETAKQIISKVVLQATRANIQDATSRPDCGILAPVHAMKEAFLKEEAEAVLLVNASNVLTHSTKKPLYPTYRFAHALYQPF